MKLDVNVLRYLSKDDFRVLTAVEMGMRNHEIVPVELIERIACLKHGGTYKVMRNLLKYKLLHHDSSKYDGFRLTYLGYDFLAVKTLVNRGVFSHVGRQIGVGKESDIFEVANDDGTIMAMKLHRLGRTSFRAVKNKRDYLRHRSSFNWLYLSRLAALKEFSFMKALGEHGFPVPAAVECNRHCVIMSLVQGYPLVQVKQIQNPEAVFEAIIGLVTRLAEHGLIHCDFNEFNIMIDDDEKVTMIDFPQMVSVSHRNAQMYFDRDVECIFKFFRKRFNKNFEEAEADSNRSEADGRICFSSIVRESGSLDKELAASGFTKKNQNDIQRFLEGELDKDEDFESDKSSESDEEGTADDKLIPELPNSITEGLDSLTLLSQPEKSSGPGDQNCNEAPKNIEDAYHTDDKPEKSSEPVDQNPDEAPKGDEDAHHTDDEENKSNPKVVQDDPELVKSLSKQRRRAILQAKGRHKAVSSRNSYKDKGGKASQNSKIQRKELSGW